MEFLLKVFVSDHLRKELPQLSSQTPLSSIPVSQVNTFVKATFPDFDLVRNLHLEDDGVNDDDVGRVCSLIFLLYETTGQRSTICGFRSARYCNGKEEFGQCFWLENGCTRPTGVGRGAVFLKLTHGFLFNTVRAASMYVQVDASNKANESIYRLTL
jgi:hypothetical protein